MPIIQTDWTDGTGTGITNCMLPFIVGSCFVLSLLSKAALGAQVRAMRRDGSAAGVSLASNILTALSYAAWVAMGACTHDAAVLWIQLPGALLGAAVVAANIYYRRCSPVCSGHEPRAETETPG
jgi:hypothetical protein